MVTRIPLTRGLVALVDDADAPAVLAAGKWYANPHRTTHYARRALRREGRVHRRIMLHTFLTGWDYVDHINGDGLDNRRTNLRPATPEQNGWNRGPLSTNTSGFKGVCASRGRWKAELRTGGRSIFLGRFDTPEAAARAYDAAAREIHGEFARLNIPQES